MAPNSAPYRLGIDLGTNSLGFALVELKDGLPYQPRHMGVRIFSDGREAKTGASLAVDRRTARGMRRRRDRFVRRQHQVMEQLIAIGLMPKERAERKKLELLDPYWLRTKGIDEKLSPPELGRILFHLNQRRGFQSNRKQAAKDKDAGAISAASEKLKATLLDQGHRTIGEFLYRRDSNSSKRVRAAAQGSKTVYEFYPQRDMLKAEYDLLLAVQAQYHPALLTPEVVSSIKDTIFYQRPLRPVQNGRCSLLPDKERAYAALPSSQRFRILKEVNNLEILDKLWRRNRNDLTDDQRQKVIADLYKKKTASFDGLRKTLKLDAATVFNLESEQREKLQGADTGITLSKDECFGEIWNTLTLEKQDEIVGKLLDDTLPYEKMTAWLESQFDTLTERQIKAILDVPLDDGTLRYSTEAINHLLPYLEEGKNEHDAREACKAAGLFPDARGYDGQILDELPYYGELLETHVAFGSGKPEDAPEKRYGKIPNPTVHIALNQVRRLINELLANYGRPAEIAIELSRDLKLTKKDKDRLNKEIAKNTKENERYDNQIQEAGLQPGNEYRLRFKLYQQQNGHCAYSGRAISVAELLSDKVEVDHILPFSRTFDDTAANKTVVFREYNRIKGNKAPHEAFQNHTEINYDELLARVNIFPGSKKWRFLPDAMKRFEEENQSGDKGWLARQLNDTSYMARVARDYLRYVTGSVDTYPGGVTAKLRRAWGFNSLLNPEGEEKNRDDHRHHAIDALVIACANRSMLNAISKASGEGEKIDEDWLKRVPKPFPNYSWAALKECVDAIVVSHKPDHGSPGIGGSTSGRLHKDTFYGEAKNQEDLKDGQIRLRVRKTMNPSDPNGLKPSEVRNICDPLIRRNLAYALDDSRDKTPEQVILSFGKEHNIRHIRLFFEESLKSMKAIKDNTGKPYRYVATGSNHHVDIYCPIKDNKSLKIKAGLWYAETASTFDANQKGYEPQWRKDHPTAKLVMRLHINDMVIYEDENKLKRCRVQKISNKASGISIFLKQHNDALTADGWGASANQLQKKNARKIAITPAGKVLDPGKAPMPKPFRENNKATA